MKRFLIACIFLGSLFRLFSQSTYALFPVCENGLWGFIDSTGREVISPKYLSAGDFVEGLAPVQIGGRFGYIDLDDQLQIAAQFDYAEPFQGGLGKVWLEGRPFFVDKTGRLTYDNIFLKIDGFKNGSHKAIITTHTHKMGVIDRSGRFALDTISLFIWGFADKYVVEYFDSSVIAHVPLEDTTYTIKRPAVALLDSIGQVVVPTGIYEEIIPDGRMAMVRFVGESGEYNRNYITSDGHFHKLTENQYRKWKGTGKLPEIDGTRQNPVENKRSGFSNPLPHTDWAQLGSGLWACQDQYYYWRLWDEQTGETLYRDLLFIDTSLGVKHGLLRISTKGSTMIYVNRRCEVIWQERPKEISSVRKKKFTVHRSGYLCPLLTQLIEDTTLSRKFDRYFHSSLVATDKISFLPDSVELILRPEDTTTFQFQYEAFKCYFYNGSQDTLFLRSGSSRPSLQALDKNGEWKSIEFRSPYSCGFGKPILYLAPKEYFEYAVPNFEGEMETQMRAVMWSSDPAGKGHPKLLISNSVKTKINPGQFWRVPDRSPTGVVIPHSESPWK